MKELLSRFIDHEVGINYLRPHHIDPAIVIAASKGFFSVRGQSDQSVHHYPYNNIIQIAEKEGGIEIGGPFTHKHRYEVIIKIGHLVDVVPVA